jgi:hypothetical protein
LKAEFSPHGSCHFSVNKNIICIDAAGPWNLEFFKQMHRELYQIVIDQVDINNFAILLVLRGDSFAAQDGLDYHLYRVQNSPTTALAITTKHSIAPQLTQDVFAKVYDKAGLENQCFDDVDDAIAWLNTKLG